MQDSIATVQIQREKRREKEEKEEESQLINVGGFCNFLSLQYNSEEKKRGEEEDESQLINVGGERGAGTAGTLR